MLQPSMAENPIKQIWECSSGWDGVAIGFVNKPVNTSQLWASWKINLVIYCFVSFIEIKS